jgi:hypothetical protein
MRTLFAFAALALAAGAQAQVVTIDQAKALAGNVTPGDMPGFPVVISQPGSYRLTGPLTVGDLSQSALIVTAPNVTLDLNGFAVSGPRCGPLRCQIVQSSTHGILVQAKAAIIANGVVDAFGGNGIATYRDADLLLERVHLRRNGFCGVGANGASVMRDVVASENAYCGVHAEPGGVIVALAARNNGRYQVSAANGSLLSSSSLVGPSPQIVGGVTSNGDNLCTVPGSAAVKC